MAIDNRRDQFTPEQNHRRTDANSTWLIAAAVAVAIIGLLIWAMGSATDRSADTNTGPSVQTFPTTPAPPSDPVVPPPTP